MLRFENRIRYIWLILFIIWNFKQGICQQFTRTCQDPLVAAGHPANFGHSFCYHSCGYDLGAPVPVGLEVCTANGICQCNYPCDSAPPANQFGDQCPAYATDPPDPDPTAPARCNQDCAGLCTGGTGLVCGEVYNQGLGPNMDIWAKICTCYCPPQPCVTTTTTTTTTTTPTPITTTTTTAIVLVKNPILPKIKLKLKIWKVIKFCILVMKLCALWWIKVLFWSCYYYMMSDWIMPTRNWMGGVWQMFDWDFGFLSF
ncbi:hypothetical protein Fcan01_06691 [Folsomia candida]|uniref:Uncharacterized protein n=1 Tax=Folsomia candida TaxID=158441 RepID=A0A226EH21_FOLCA|nr:hypothetical protein Fcan01_06691 [Folsomia candida]